MRKLDHPLETFNVNFVFLRGDIVAGSGSGGGLPAALGRVQKGLAAGRLTAMSLLSTLAYKFAL